MGWRRCLETVVSIFLCSTAGPADERAAGRVPLAAAAQTDWAAVGRLNVTAQGFCTGTLIAPDLVLTAGHCLVDRRTGATVAPGRVHFLAGFRIGGYVAHQAGVAVAVDPGFFGDGQPLPHDLGVVRLAAPLAPEITPLPVIPVDTGDRLSSYSYGMDRSQMLSRQGSCRVLRRAGPVIQTNCNGVPGVSGAPLVVERGDAGGLAAVAVAVPRGPNRLGPREGLIGVLPTRETIEALSRAARAATGP